MFWWLEPTNILALQWEDDPELPRSAQCNHCCSVAKSCPTLCHAMDCSTPNSLSFTISQSLLKFMSIESVMLSNHLILCSPFSSRPQAFPASGSFPMSQLFAWGGQSIGTSALATALPMNVQGRFALGLTGLISLQSKGLSGVFSSTTLWKHQFFVAQPCLWSNSYICTWLLKKP